MNKSISHGGVKSGGFLPRDGNGLVLTRMVVAKLEKVIRGDDGHGFEFVP